MPGLTRALTANHGRGRNEAFGPALLDIAQDHLLYLLAVAGRFDGDGLIFKGGTSLRKCRIGGNGRFSTDIDFAAPSDEVVLEVCGLIDGAVIGGFHYRLGVASDDGRHWDMTIEHDEFGPVQARSSVEFARRPLVRPPERLAFVRLQVHQASRPTAAFSSPDHWRGEWRRSTGSDPTASTSWAPRCIVGVAVIMYAPR